MVRSHISNMACSATSSNLPPGFAFRPTDVEIVLHFLYPKVMLLPCCPNFIPSLDLSLHDPWELYGLAFARNTKYYYFFSKLKDCRIGKSGYWKELDSVQPIFSSDNAKVGFKKYLVFNMGDEASESAETIWLMQEYHICPSELNMDSKTTVHNSNQGRRKFDYCNKMEWVLCRMYERDRDFGPPEQLCCMDEEDSGSEVSLLDELFLQSSDIEDDDLDGVVIRLSF